MKKLIVFTLITFGFTQLSLSQNISFKKTYGNNGFDYGRGLIQLADSGYLITGSSSSYNSNSTDALLLHVDSLGNRISSNFYGGNGTDWGEKLTLGADSSIAICGYTNSEGAGGFDFYLLNLAQNKTVNWEKSYGGSDWDFAYDIAPLADSGYILVGETQSFGALGTDAYMIRVNKFGDTLWTKRYGAQGDDTYRRIKMLDTDTFLVVGAYQHPDSISEDGLIQKMTIDGDLIWEKHLGGDFYDCLYGVDTTQFGFVVAGTRSTSEDFSIRSLYGFHDDGTFIYFNTANYSGDKWSVRDIAFKSSNNKVYLIMEAEGATIPSFPEGNDVVILSNQSWDGWHDGVINERLGRIGNDEAREIISTSDDGLAFVGSITEYSTGGGNVMFVKYGQNLNPLGNNNWDFDSILNVQNNIETVIEDVKIFPNPASEEIVIQSTLNFDRALFVDLSGRVLANVKLNNNKTAIPKTLKNGSYFLVLLNEKTTLQEQVVIAR